MIPEKINGYPVTEIDEAAFYGKETVKVGEWAFGNNMEATAIIIEEGVETIGEFAFQNNQTATSIKIPSTVTLIGKGALKSGRKRIRQRKNIPSPTS